jgi:hypothetical protein
MRKRWILMCAAWTLVTLSVGLFGVWRIHSNPLPDVPGELWAARLGLGIGVITATGYAAFWLILAFTARKKDDRSQEHEIPKEPRTK